MTEITKLTTTYDAEQDRVRIGAQDAKGQTIELWLTQRLADRLIARLLQHLDLDVKITATPAASKVPLKEIQSWEQSAARTQLKKCEPVRAEGKLRQILVTAIDISRQDNRLLLLFQQRDERVAAMPFSMTELRQWLGIMHDIYLKANWPCQMWPSWFASPVVAKAAVILH